MDTNYVTRAELERMISEFKNQMEADALRRYESQARWRVVVQAKQEKHDKTLYGNGEPGMDEILRNTNKATQELTATMSGFIEAQQMLQEKRRMERRTESNQIRVLTYAALLSLVAQVFLKFLP